MLFVVKIPEALEVYSKHNAVFVTEYHCEVTPRVSDVSHKDSRSIDMYYIIFYISQYRSGSLRDFCHGVSNADHSV